MAYVSVHLLKLKIAELCLRVFAIVVFLLVSMTASGVAKSPVIKNIVIQERSDGVLISIASNQQIGFKAITTANPYRLVISFDAADFDLPLGAGRDLAGVISAYRYGQIDNDKAKIVFDATAPLVITSSKSGKKGKESRIEIVVRETDANTFAALDKQVVTTGPPAVQTATDEPPFADMPRTPDGSRIVVLDPGHGGIDPGAISATGTLEKDVVFKFATALKKKIEARGGYKVLLTRNEDKYVALPKRVKFARENRADLFIALHADSISGTKGKGITFYTLSDKASDEESAALARRENLADAIAGIDLGEDNEQVADVLLELLQRESRNHAIFFARKAVEKLKPVTQLTGKPVRAASFKVLKAPDVPSLLIELGFLSSVDDSKQLTSDAWQAKTSAAIALAVDHYFAQEIPVNSTSRIGKKAD